MAKPELMTDEELAAVDAELVAHHAEAGRLEVEFSKQNIIASVASKIAAPAQKAMNEARGKLAIERRAISQKQATVIAERQKRVAADIKAASAENK